ncbi:fimbria/pilus periplasmic chaperone [Aeromonas hydrophila]|uniref:fimbria/pilus periplasmic chaperone n=1 Tax=Aeromonas hydrophila TaxID=644 RepID=UPI0009B89BC8|nr:fimbria/pilus periplasmic chaperone [Aeromonas hydrophila]
MKFKIFITLFFSIFIFNVYADGISLGATRVIYISNNKQVSLSVNNSSRETAFMLQAWVENNQGEQTHDFVITPPLFMIKPSQENILRIMFYGKALPADRESVYWVNVKAIPPKPSEDGQGKNTLQLAVLNKIKLFYRPVNLAMTSDTAFRSLKVKKGKAGVTIDNPTPYHITIVNVKINNKLIDGTMINPFDSVHIDAHGTVRSFSYQTINDYGALSEVRND